MAAPKASAAGRKPRRKEKKNIAVGQAHIKSTFNNTIVSITDPSGAVIAWASGGDVGYKGSRKSTPFAAGLAAESAARPRHSGWLSTRASDIPCSSSRFCNALSCSALSRSANGGYSGRSLNGVLLPEISASTISASA